MIIVVYLVQLLLLISTFVTTTAATATATENKNKNADLFDLAIDIKEEVEEVEGRVRGGEYDNRPIRPNNNNIFETRIVGGDESDIDEFPYFVSINGICGGALITPDTVLFAAHCGNRTNDAIIVGAYKYQNNAGNASERFCDELIQSPRFGEGGVRLRNDVALCKLHAPVYINKSVTKLVLNNNSDIPSVVDGIGDDLIVMGFGLEKEHEEGGVIQQTLRDVIVPYVTNEVCSASYGNIFPEMLCAGFIDGKFDACQGDSGGPIVEKIFDKSTGLITHVHVGIVSYGTGCARPDFPGVYARTSSTYDWIVDQVCNKWKSIDPDLCPYNLPLESSNKILSQNTCSSIGKHNLTILLQTDQYATETSWKSIKQSTNEVILSEDRYKYSYFSHMDSTCVEEGESYTFEIKDDYGDGLCAPGLDCGSYTIKLDDEVIKVSDGMFGASDTFLFSVAAPSASPTETPTTAPSASPTETPTTAPSASPGCGPDKKLRFKNKRRRNCKWVRRGKRRNKKRKKCKKKWKGKRLSFYCPASCGRVGVGPCA